jgi:uncharacterized caspase-like protein/Flp pilus assembly protein TadD
MTMEAEEHIGEPQDPMQAEAGQEDETRHTRPTGTSRQSGKYRPDYESSWAVVIGIDNYQHARKLSYAVKDAVGMGEILVSRLGFTRDRVLAILDPAPERQETPYTLVSSDATKAAIEELLYTHLPGKAGNDDRVLIFYAGHGESRKLPNDEERGYLVPANGKPGQWHTCIDLDGVIEAGEFFKAKHIFYLLDSCYSGLATVRSTVKPTRYEADMLTRKARQVLTAGNAEQVVADKGPDGHSLFTGYVLEGLRGEAAQKNSDVITASDLMVYVKDRVGRQHGSHQTPDIGPLPGHQSGGDFVFRLPELSVTPEDHVSLGCFLYDLGQRLNDPGRYSSAVLHSEEALVAPDLPEPQAARARTTLGKTWLAVGDTLAAIQAMEPLVERDDAPAETLLYLGMAHARQRAYPQARKFLEKFATRSPDDANTPWVAAYLDWMDGHVGAQVHALLIGINTYSAFPPLSGCVNDVNIMQKILTSMGGYPEKNICTLLDTDGTFDNILAALEDLQDQDIVGRSDTVLVHYSGHSVPESHRVEYRISNDRDVYLVLNDTVNDRMDISKGGEVSNSLSAMRLHNLMNAIPATHKTLILDTHPSFELIKLAEKEGDYTLLMASDAAEVAFERTFNFDGTQVRAGLFTGVLWQTLNTADPQKITYGTLIGAMIEGIKKLGFDQTPVFVGYRSDGPFLPKDLFLRLFEFTQRRTYPAISLDAVRRLYERFCQQVSVSYPQAHLSFGLAFLEKGDGQAATKALKKSLQQADGDHTGTLLSLVRAQLETGHYNDALDSLQRYLESPLAAGTKEETNSLQASVEACAAPRRHAVLVGIGRYTTPDIPEVPGTSRDIQRIKETLLNHMGFLEDDIAILEDGNATRDNIIEHFQRLVKSAQHEPALFYFAGHGSLTAEGYRALVSADGHPEDVNEITLKELAEIAGDGATNLLTIIDTGSKEAVAFDTAIRNLTHGTGILPPGSDEAIDLEEYHKALVIGLMSIYAHSVRDETGQRGKSSGRMTVLLMQALRKADPNASTYQQWLEQAFPDKKSPRPTLVGEAQDEMVFGNTVRKNEALRAINHIEQSRVRQTVDLLRKLVSTRERAGQSAPVASVDLGVAYAAVGERQLSIQTLNRALDLYDAPSLPESQLGDDSEPSRWRAEAHYQLGRILYEGDKTESGLNQAISHLSRATEQDPNNIRAFYYHGQALRTLVDRTTLADAQRVLRVYLVHGAPLGHEDEVRSFLGARQKPAVEIPDNTPLVQK